MPSVQEKLPQCFVAPEKGPQSEIGVIVATKQRGVFYVAPPQRYFSAFSARDENVLWQSRRYAY